MGGLHRYGELSITFSERLDVMYKSFSCLVAKSEQNNPHTGGSRPLVVTTIECGEGIN